MQKYIVKGQGISADCAGRACEYSIDILVVADDPTEAIEIALVDWESGLDKAGKIYQVAWKMTAQEIRKCNP